jgi:hypothetical protein
MIEAMDAQLVLAGIEDHPKVLLEVDPRAVELRGGLLMDHTLRM